MNKSQVYIISSLLIFCLIFGILYLYKLVTKPISELETSFALDCRSILEKQKDKSIIDDVVFHTSEAQYIKNIALIKYHLKYNDIKNAQTCLNNMPQKWHKRIASVYIQSSEKRIIFSLEKSRTTYENALYYALIYIRQREIFYKDRSIFFAQKLPLSLYTSYTQMVSREFLENDMLLENLQYWEKLDTQYYDISLANPNLIINNKNIPEYAKQKMRYLPMRYFAKTIDNYNNNKINKQTAYKQIADKYNDYINSQGAFMLSTCVGDICVFLAKIGYKKEAIEMLQKFARDKDSSIHIKSTYVTLNRAIQTMKFYISQREFDKAESIIYKEKNYSLRLKLLSSFISELAKQDFLMAKNHFLKTQEFYSLIKLYYPFLHAEK